jgi:NlpC/P60 family
MRQLRNNFPISSRFNLGDARTRALAVCAAWLCCALPSIASGQTTAPPREAHPKVRLATAKEGRAIVTVVLAHEQPAPGAEDCSHLVHEIYERAGFVYPYASSNELYAGSESFARVKNPQPGDVIVWPGHAGIVFDVKHHLFYSVVRTGLETSDYEAPYWRARGRPRFYRYIVGNHAGIVTAKSLTATRASENAERQDTGQVVEEASREEDSAAKKTATAAAERTAVYASADPETTRVAATTAPPQSIAVGSGRKQPTREQIGAGISELSNTAANVLRTGDAAGGGTPVVILDRLQVESVEFKHDRGWAVVQVESRASIAEDQTDFTKRSEEVRWELRRGKSGWEAVSPADRTFVSRDAAVKSLSAQLAKLAQSSDGPEQAVSIRQQESRLAKLLSVILESE